jgi:hypothetical protein
VLPSTTNAPDCFPNSQCQRSLSPLLKASIGTSNNIPGSRFPERQAFLQDIPRARPPLGPQPPIAVRLLLISFHNELSCASKQRIGWYNLLGSEKHRIGLWALCGLWNMAGFGGEKSPQSYIYGPLLLVCGSTSRIVLVKYQLMWNSGLC